MSSCTLWAFLLFCYKGSYFFYYKDSCEKLQICNKVDTLSTWHICI